MNFKTISFSTLALIMLFVSQLNAQEVYRAEIGFNGGTSYYLGDANNKLFNNSQLTYGLIYRHKFSPRLAAHLNWNYSKVIGEATLASGTVLNFENPINAVDFCGEYNFFELEDKDYKPFSKKYSTYIFAGLGTMFYTYENNPDWMFSYPFGVGFKMMLGNRLNLNLQWTNRLLLTDQMEGELELNDPFKLNGSNLMNYDMLSTLSIGLTFDILKTKCKCLHNNF